MWISKHIFCGLCIEYFLWNFLKFNDARPLWWLPTLVQLIAWSQQAIGHYLNQWRLPSPMMPYPDSKAHGANIGPIWVLLAPGGPQVGPMTLAIRVYTEYKLYAYFVGCTLDRIWDLVNWSWLSFYHCLLIPNYHLNISVLQLGKQMLSLMIISLCHAVVTFIMLCDIKILQVTLNKW